MPEKVEKLDIIETLISNLFWMMFGLITITFAYESLKFLNTFQEEQTRLLATVIIAFAIIKLFSWIGHPRVVYKAGNDKIVY